MSILMEGVSNYGEPGLGVFLVDGENAAGEDRLVVAADCGGGFGSTKVDLEELIGWVAKHEPYRLSEALDKHQDNPVCQVSVDSRKLMLLSACMTASLMFEAHPYDIVHICRIFSRLVEEGSGSEMYARVEKQFLAHLGLLHSVVCPKGKAQLELPASLARLGGFFYREGRMERVQPRNFEGVPEASTGS